MRQRVACVPFKMETLSSSNRLDFFTHSQFIKLSFSTFNSLQLRLFQLLIVYNSDFFTQSQFIKPPFSTFNSSQFRLFQLLKGYNLDFFTHSQFIKLSFSLFHVLQCRRFTFHHVVTQTFSQFNIRLCSLFLHSNPSNLAFKLSSQLKLM